jgi:hypothetical protein
MLSQLEIAGARGMAEAKMIGYLPAMRERRIAALERLRRDGTAVRRKKGKGVMWYLARHGPSVEEAMTSLRTRGATGGMVAWTLVELRRLLPPVQRELVAQALSRLAAEGEVRELRAVRGPQRFWIFTQALSVPRQTLEEGVA